MRLLIVLLCIFSIIAFASEPFVTKSGIKYSSDRIIVKMKSDTVAPKSAFITHHTLLFGNTYVVYTKNLHQLEQDLKLDTAVLYTQRDYHSEKKPLPKPQAVNLKNIVLNTNSPFNDVHLSRQWSFLNAAEFGISVNKAYTEIKSKPKADVIVAVVDTGVDYTHRDLKEKMWKNPGEIADNNIDDDNNGYVDDIYGINTLIRDSNGKATTDVRDAHSHGTHVSGIIAAQQNNNEGIAGISSRARIMAIRTVPNFSDEKDVDVIEAFVYAAKHGARIINCSFGKNHNEGGLAVSDAIAHIGEKYGTLVVAASGNSSRNIDIRPTYPASFENGNLFVVASTSSFGSMSSFSNFGIKSVDVAAPGSSVFSCVPNNRYSSMSGTSMASPTVAGVAAEVLAHFPGLTPLQLKKVVMDSVVKVSSFSGKIQTGGRVDLHQALEMASTIANIKK